MEAPIYLKGKARRGPTFRECILMHAVARLVFHNKIPNIQASWVKLGLDGLSACLQAGVNDVGGSLMNETITRSAGAVHGQEILPEQLERTIRAAGRVPAQRTTFYREPSDRQKAAAYGAPALSLNQNTPLRQMAKKIPRVKNEIYAEFITKI
jgi:FO synthase